MKPTLTAPLMLSFLGYLCLAGCRPASSSAIGDSVLMTDLGPEGNAHTEKQVQTLQTQLGNGFVQENGRRRVLLTGFNPFQGGSQNISGDLISHMESQGQGNVERRQVEGAVVTRREMVINGETIDAYYLRADTNYTSPALIHAAAAQIQPDRMLSFGQAKRTQIEHGGSNNANTEVAGYDRQGKVSPLMNSSPRVDELDDALSTTRPTWDPEAIRQSTGFPLSNGARPDNNYICNATEYTMQKSLTGNPIQYTPNMRLDPIVKPATANTDRRFAFIHLAPQNQGQTREETLNSYSNAIQRTIGDSFNAPTGSTNTASPQQQAPSIQQAPMAQSQSATKPQPATPTGSATTPATGGFR